MNWKDTAWIGVSLTPWYILAANHWYSMGANGWYTMPANGWYIIARKMTAGIQVVLVQLAQVDGLLAVFIAPYHHTVRVVEPALRNRRVKVTVSDPAVACFNWFSMVQVCVQSRLFSPMRHVMRFVNSPKGCH
jgi:hypothetical protein